VRRTLAVVMAHPDDECYPTYGTVARHADDPTFRLVVLHVTDGEGGEIADGVPVTRERLGAWRREEDTNAWRALGRVPDRHVWLGLPDGGLEQVGVEPIRDAVIGFFQEERPNVVVTMALDGVTGHPDHIVVARATTEAFHVVRAEGGAGLQRLLYGAVPQSGFEKTQRWREGRGKPVWDPTRTYHLRGTPDDQIGAVSDNRHVVHRVLAAIKEHGSQRHVLYDSDVSDEDWTWMLQREQWIIAWPPREPGQPLLQGMFAGLDENW
jgi:LmbE family N-acetylglucosaminyl deacetylase